MNIAFFHEVPYGGARRVVYEFGKHLRRKHRVSLYYVDREEDKDAKEIFFDFHFYPFFYKAYMGKDWRLKLYKDTIELGELYLLHKRIASEINKKRFDVVFIHPSQFTQGPFLLRFIKVPTIYYCQEPLRIVYDTVVEMPKLPFVKRTYERTIRLMRKFIDRSNVDCADLLLANSRYSKEAIKKAYQKDAKVCYLGVDTLVFQPLNVSKAYDIVFVGGKTEVKGYDLLVKTVSYFKKKPKIATIGGRKEGFLTDRDLVWEYNKGRVVAVFGRNEPFGLVALEAMACGTPVIALSEGGFKETVVDGKTGFLVPPDPNSIYERLNHILQNPSLQKKIGKQAREYVVTNWTWERSVSRFLKIAKDFLEERDKL